MSLNLLFKTVLIILLLVGLILLYKNLFGKIAQNSADEVSVRAQLANITKVIAVNVSDSGDYGSVTSALPYTGCDLANSFLSNENVKDMINKLSHKTEITCVSDGKNGKIFSWAIAAKINKDKYWCVDEKGSRQEISHVLQASFCE